MAVARSSDGGRTWKSTFFALERGQTKFDDKPYIAVDDNPSSPHRDTIHVAWDRFDGSASSFNGALLSRSADGGTIFSAPRLSITTPPRAKVRIRPHPFLRPDGTVHVAWHH